MIPSKLLSSGSLRLWFTALRFCVQQMAKCNWFTEIHFSPNPCWCLPALQLPLIAFRYKLHADSLVLIVCDTLHGALFI